MVYFDNSCFTEHELATSRSSFLTLAQRPERGYKPEPRQKPDEIKWTENLVQDRKQLENLHWYRKAIKELEAVYKGNLQQKQCRVREVSNTKGNQMNYFWTMDGRSRCN